MNPDWKEFLSAQQAQLSADGNAVFNGGAHSGALLYPLGHLAVLTVAGKDATKFLQGQCTCDINAISATQGGIGAFCNAKGRAIAVFLIVQRDDGFLIVLPAAQIETVKNHLQRYILRAAVKLSDSRDNYCLIGLEGVTSENSACPLPTEVYGTTQADGDILLHMPSKPPRYLLLASADSAAAHWEALRNLGFKPADTALWRNRDLTAGIPWLDADNSEQFIPQMLNLDRLGGIGFRKGCYTGQEVVARTQYLGEVKRRMYYVECAAEAEVAAGAGIVDADSSSATVVGKLLTAQRGEQHWQMLAVLQTGSAESQNLWLQNLTQDKISVKPLRYPTDAAD